ncbi:MAG: hypothetical protein ACJ8LG_21595 [Massilia sp.]
MDRGDELQAEAVALVKRYGLFLPAPVRSFLAKMADFLNWDNLKKEL